MLRYAVVFHRVSRHSFLKVVRRYARSVRWYGTYSLICLMLIYAPFTVDIIKWRSVFNAIQYILYP